MYTSGIVPRKETFMKFKVGDEVRALCDSLYKGIKKGEIGIVKALDYECEDGKKRIRIVPINGYRDGLFLAEELELAEPKLTKNQRIAALEKEVDELKTIVHQLRESNITIEDVKRHFNITSPAKVFATLPSTDDVVEGTIEFEGKPYKKVDRLAREGDVVVFTGVEGSSQLTKDNTPYAVIRNSTYQPTPHSSYYGVYGWGEQVDVDVYELIEHQTVEDKPKTANELRAEIIEKAKLFVDENGGDDYHFEIDEKERQILAWKIVKRGAKTGLSTCHPNEVFNEDIGRAIAFGRAEKLDVSKFEQAVQPTFEIGQIIEFINYQNKTESFQIVEVDDEKVWFRDIDGQKVYVNKCGSYSGDGTYKPTIINDTNAIYGRISWGC